MSELLPKIKDRKHYKQLFTENHLWQPVISFLINQHQLSGEVRRGVLGSHVVYQVGSSWIKLMAPIFANDMVYEVSGLQAVEGRLSVASPRQLATGDIEGWKYIILSHVDGQPIRKIWTSLTTDQKVQLTRQMARVTKEIHQCPPDEVIQSRFIWNNFIEQQYKNIYERQKEKSLPISWLEQVETFLKKFSLSDFQTSSSVFLHADLTFDHFLVTAGSQVSGILDFADCQVGHLEYELVAPAVFIFKGQKQLLRQYLIDYGFNEETLTSEFSEKLMAWTLLHRFCAIITYFQDEMDSCSAGDFRALALKVFPL